jgi:hypothetical protein
MPTIQDRNTIINTAITASIHCEMADLYESSPLYHLEHGKEHELMLICEHIDRHEQRPTINHNFYHRNYKFNSIIKSTEKSYYIDMVVKDETKPMQLWIPKKICRDLSLVNKTVMIHFPTLGKIVETFNQKKESEP